VTQRFEFGRPYGTWNGGVARLPSDESLGYFRASLRDRDAGMAWTRVAAGGWFDR
jgi:hypothetical protein